MSHSCHEPPLQPGFPACSGLHAPRDAGAAVRSGALRIPVRQMVSRSFWVWPTALEEVMGSVEVPMHLKQECRCAPEGHKHFTTGSAQELAPLPIHCGGLLPSHCGWWVKGEYPCVCKTVSYVCIYFREALFMHSTCGLGHNFYSQETS